MRNHSLRIGKYRLVLLAGCLATSSAGATIWSWSEQPIPVGNYPLDDVAASPTAVVAVGHDDETILRSTDGKDWEVIDLDPPGFLDHVSYLDEVFVAVGSAGLRYSTDDGQTWQVPLENPLHLASITRFQDTWMAFGPSGLAPEPVVLLSDDLQTWELITEPPLAVYGLSIRSVATNGETLAIVGIAGAPSVDPPQLLATNGADKWEDVTPEHGAPGNLKHDGERFLGTGAGSDPASLNTSVDGFDWQRVEYPELGDAYFGRLAMGESGYLASIGRSGARTALVFSTDLESWLLETTIDSGPRGLVAFNNGWVGVGDVILRGEPASSSAIPALSPGGLAVLLLVLGGAGVVVVRFRA